MVALMWNYKKIGNKSICYLFFLQKHAKYASLGVDKTKYDGSTYKRNQGIRNRFYL